MEKRLGQSPMFNKPFLSRIRRLAFGLSYLLLSGILCFFNTYAQQVTKPDNSFRPTYVYKGYIQSGVKKIEINLHFLILLDSTIVGSYYYNQQDGDLKLSGRLYASNKFTLSEWDSTEKLTGTFTGILSKDKKHAEGKWIAPGKNTEHIFHLEEVKDRTYWYYIKKNRALYEYTDFNTAIRAKGKVLSIDVARKDLITIPAELSVLPNIVSINLLGNKFPSFPSVLSKLNSLEEISLSSNGLNYIGSEIGRLKNLRILIMNLNKLKALPKEIGQLQNLLYLDLGRNQLKRLPDEIKYLTSLQELHIDNNQLTEVEKQKIKKALPNCLIHF